VGEDGSGPAHETAVAGSGPTLLLIHPLGGSVRFWDDCRGLWGERYRIAAFDWAGGVPRSGGKAPSLAEFVRQIEALRRSLGCDGLIPVGVAVGSMIAAAYAAAYPRQVTALVLSNPAIALSPASRGVTLERLDRIRKGGIAAILPEVVDRAFGDLAHDAAYRKYLAEFRGNDPRAYARNALAALDMNIAADLERIACPVLVIAGERDTLLPPVEAQRVAAAIPKARYRALAAAHFPPIQTPAAFAAEVDAFLAMVIADRR
jgi:3-oxoadipate enol-lactonase